MNQKKEAYIMITKFQGQMTSSFYENIKYMDTTLPIHESFDIIRRSIKIADKQAVFYFIDGFTKWWNSVKNTGFFISN